MKQKGEEQHILQLQSWKSNKQVESNREMPNIAIAILIKKRYFAFSPN